MLNNYKAETFLPNIVAALSVTTLMFLLYYLTKVGKVFNEDSLGKVQYESETQKKLTDDVYEIEKALAELSDANTEIVNDISNLSAMSEEITALAQQSADMTEGNFNNTKHAKEILEDILTVSHELDKYIV